MSVTFRLHNSVPVFLFSWYRWMWWDTDRLRNLSKVTASEKWSWGLKPGYLLLEQMCLTTDLYCSWDIFLVSAWNLKGTRMNNLHHLPHGTPFSNSCHLVPFHTLLEFWFSLQFEYDTSTSLLLGLFHDNFYNHHQHVSTILALGFQCIWCYWLFLWICSCVIMYGSGHNCSLLI